MKEKDLKQGEAAYVFVTNMNFHLHLDEFTRAHGVLAHGLGIPDFAKVGIITFREKYRQKQKHVDAHDILQALGDYPKIPTTFDGSLPSETYGNAQSIKIGETYFFEDIGEGGLVAKVTTATVSEPEQTVFFGTDKGQILTRKLSDSEMSDYKNHPDTYFGIVQRNSKPTNDPYEFFENLIEIHKDYPREHFLNNMGTSVDIASLRELPQEELVLIYCERLAASLGSKK